MYLSFVNLAFSGDEGDVFGNVLAILCGAGQHEPLGQRIVQTISTAQADRPLSGAGGAAPADAPERRCGDPTWSAISRT